MTTVSNRDTRAHDGPRAAMECKLLRVYRAASLLLTSLERAANDTYRMNPGDVLFLRRAVDDVSEAVRREVGR